MRYVCEECGWSPGLGSMVQVPLTPREMGQTSHAQMACFVEVERFIAADCRGHIGVTAEEGEML